MYSSKPQKQQLEKWLEIFERDTRAWKRIYYRINNFDKKVTAEEDAIQSLYKLYPGANVNKISIKDVFYKIKELRKSSNRGLALSLGIDPDTLRKYRNLLKRANIIDYERSRDRGREITISYNDWLRDWRVPRID